MHLRSCLIPLALLLCSGCAQPVSKVRQETTVLPEPDPFVERDEQYRNQLLLGLEELDRQQTGQLEQLANESPDSLWGATARRILNLQTRLQKTSLELEKLHKAEKTLSRQRAELLTENRELKHKLDELTRLLVELENRHH